PRVTRCAIHGGALASEAADRWVSDTLAGSGTLYTLDEALLRRLEPDVLITQRLCDVCAVGYGTVTAFAATLPGPPHVINLDPSSVGDVLQDIESVGTALGGSERAPAGRSSPPSAPARSMRSTAPRTSAVPAPAWSTASRCSPRSCTPSCSRAASPRAPSVASRRTSSPRAERAQCTVSGPPAALGRSAAACASASSVA